MVARFIPRWVFPSLISLFAFISKDRLDFSSVFQKGPTHLEYDYIIVGGGSAGSVLANRLSQDSSMSVLLLEAGDEETPESQVPALAQYLQLTAMDWMYQTEPSSTSCLAMVDNRCNLPQGMVLGGSSSINYMLYVRGNKHDYDQWESFGNTGWGYSHILKYFKMSEDNLDEEYNSDTDYHAVGGNQKIKKGNWQTILAEAFLEAGRELGIETGDVNGGKQTRFMIPQGYFYKGARYSAAKAFLWPIKKRKNLSILLKARVFKVLLDRTKRATGVLFQYDNNNITAYCRKEVILSAGSFGSSKLLLLSGIGPAPHLISKGITPLVDLPVGRNLQDHVAGMLTFTIDEPYSLKYSRMSSIASVYRYLTFGSGPLTTLGGVEGIGFLNTKFENRTQDWPDIQLHFTSGSPASDKGKYILSTFNIRDEYWAQYFAPLAEVDSFSVIFKLMRPRSRGFVELESSDPFEPLKITPNYLTEPADIMVLIEGLKMVKALGESSVFRKFGSKLYMTPFPGCEHLRIKTDSYWNCYLRHFTMTIYHYCGTAKMGPIWDSEAVVDPSLRVYGTTGLRVVDASIFPTIVNGNTNAAVLMVAEKASEMISDYWKQLDYNISSRNSPSEDGAFVPNSKEVSDSINEENNLEEQEL